MDGGSAEVATWGDCVGIWDSLGVTPSGPVGIVPTVNPGGSSPARLTELSATSNGVGLSSSGDSSPCKLWVDIVGVCHGCFVTGVGIRIVWAPGISPRPYVPSAPCRSDATLADGAPVD